MSFDTPAENAAFARKFSFPFPLLSDTRRELGLAYGACDDARAGSPNRITYVVDPAGRIQEAILKVDARAHPADLLQRL